MQPRHVAWLSLVLGIATAALLSALHDTLPAILARVVGRSEPELGALTRIVAAGINALGLAAIAVAIWAAWRREARIVRTYLVPEVAGGTASDDEVARLTAMRARFGRQLGLLRRRRLAELQRVRRLEAAQGELAFHNWRTAVRRRPPPAESGEVLRARIRQLREELDRDGEA